MSRYPYYQYVNFPASRNPRSRPPETNPFIQHNYYRPKKQREEILKQLCDRFGLPRIRRRSKWRVRQTATAVWLICPGKQTFVFQKIFSNKL